MLLPSLLNNSKGRPQLSRIEAACAAVLPLSGPGRHKGVALLMLTAAAHWVLQTTLVCLRHHHPHCLDGPTPVPQQHLTKSHHWGLEPPPPAFSSSCSCCAVGAARFRGLAAGVPRPDCCIVLLLVLLGLPPGNAWCTSNRSLYCGFGRWAMKKPEVMFASNSGSSSSKISGRPLCCMLLQTSREVL